MGMRDIEEDRRMAAFLQSKDFEGESWKTEEILYKEWVEAGRPYTIYVPEVRGFRHEEKEDERDSLLDEGMA